MSKHLTGSEWAWNSEHTVCYLVWRSWDQIKSVCLLQKSQLSVTKQSLLSWPTEKKEVIHAPTVPYIPRVSKTWHKPDGGQSTFKQFLHSFLRQYCTKTTDKFISSISLKWPLNSFKRVTVNILDIRHHTLQFTAALVISIVENA